MWDRKTEFINKKRWLALNPAIYNISGIYVLVRNGNGFDYAYVGQAKKILDRLAGHLSGYKQHIDKSLRTHKLFSANNLTGWRIAELLYCKEDMLDINETIYIKKYAKTHQLLNKTGGSQGIGKFTLDTTKERKGYKQGKEYGFECAMRKISQYFDKYLDFTIKGNTNKIKERKFEEFKELLKGVEDEQR